MKTTSSILLTLALCALSIGLVIVLGVCLDQATEEEIATRFSQRQLLLVEQTASSTRKSVTLTPPGKRSQGQIEAAGPHASSSLARRES